MLCLEQSNRQVLGLRLGNHVLALGLESEGCFIRAGEASVVGKTVSIQAHGAHFLFSGPVTLLRCQLSLMGLAGVGSSIFAAHLLH
jgi:hypothetical protein